MITASEQSCNCAETRITCKSQRVPQQNSCDNPNLEYPACDPLNERDKECTRCCHSNSFPHNMELLHAYGILHFNFPQSSALSLQMQRHKLHKAFFSGGQW